ncbi:hypothetical protein MNBD_GAMMA12-442 [hydrothermal vent metagenome]|uniref:Lipoprotein n=1 Tax=hydrothermal vent metagenome TaxID=652676 RepID=A0A3B0YEB4_9ZZZZ
MLVQDSNFFLRIMLTVRSRFSIGLVLSTLLLVSCGAPDNVRHRVHYSLLDKQIQLPKQVVLLPINIPVVQIRKGPIIDQLDKRSKIARSLVARKIRAYSHQKKKFKLLRLPKISKKEVAIIKHHIVLYDLVSRNAVNYTTGKHLQAWQQKLKRFDYSIGSGLKFIAQRTGAEAAIIITGIEFLVDGSISGFRGKSNILIGLVDLNSGALLWIDYVLDTKRSFNHYGDISYLIDNMLDNYPGVLSYRKTIVK